MNTSIKSTVLTAAIVALSFGAYAAQAATQNDALAASQAKISLSQAISVAEQNAGGKASQAEFDTTKAGPVYKVEVIKGTQVFDVKVDANKGTLISSTKDTIDHGKADVEGAEHDDEG